jgi:heterodisulfide reductase subunit B
MEKNRQYAFYLGCIAPNRYPGAEAAAYKTSEKLGIDLVDLKGASCCPAPGAFGSIDLNVWYAMAARNLVLAEQMNMDIALVCNGCYKSIWEVNHKLKHNEKLRNGVNAVLKEIDMQYKGTINVYHLAELLYDPEIAGVAAIADSVKTPLTGAKIAVHYGCHLMKPRKDREFKSEALSKTERPMWVDELVWALGAETVQYRNKMQCCGAGGGVRGYDIVHALDITNEKLINMKEVGAEAITDICPFCQLQFDRGQIEIKEKFGVSYNIPVLHYCELLGLAQGMNPQELALDLHGISCEPFLQKVLH